MNINEPTASINCNDLINLQAGGRRKKYSNRKKSQKGGAKSAGTRRKSKKPSVGKKSSSLKRPVSIHPEAQKVGLFTGSLISGETLLKEFEGYPLDSYITNIFNELKIADPTDRYNYNTKILGMINSMLDKGYNRFSTDLYFVDLRQKFSKIFCVLLFFLHL